MQFELRVLLLLMRMVIEMMRMVIEMMRMVMVIIYRREIHCTILRLLSILF